MSDFTKPERRELSELAGIVYEAEAHRMLEKLDAEFERWRRGDKPSSDLLSAIHDFHQRDSRDLWSMYQSLKAPEIVARGVALGLVSSGISDILRAKLEPLVEFFSKGNR